MMPLKGWSFKLKTYPSHFRDLLLNTELTFKGKKTKPLKIKQAMGSASCIFFLMAYFFLQCVKFSLHSHHPLTRNTFRSSPMPSIWISNTNKSHLFGFVWAPPCCERKVGGTGQRILELLSQNIDGTEPVPVTLQPKTHVNVLRVTSWQRRHFCLCREKVDWAWNTCSFSAPPSYS